jgi:uncharacterized protein (DUF983 family)
MKLCPYCRGLREVTENNVCKSCGSDVPRHAPKTIRKPERCPKCTDGMLSFDAMACQSRCQTCGYASGQRLLPMKTEKGARR